MPPKSRRRSTKTKTPNIVIANQTPSEPKSRTTKSREQGRSNPGSADSDQNSQSERVKPIGQPKSSAPRRSARIAESSTERRRSGRLAAARLQKETEQKAQQKHSAKSLKADHIQKDKHSPKSSTANKRRQNQERARPQNQSRASRSLQGPIITIDRGTQTEFHKNSEQRQEIDSNRIRPSHRAHLGAVQPWLRQIKESELLELPESEKSYEDMPVTRLGGKVSQLRGEQTLTYSGNGTSTHGSDMTTGRQKKYINVKEMRSLLEARGIEIDEMRSEQDDQLLRSLRDKLALDSETSLASFDEIRSQLQAFLTMTDGHADSSSKASDKRRHQNLEELMHKLHKCLPKCNAYTLTEADMQIDISRSRQSSANEYILQSTVLFSIIDRWRLAGSIFTFDCERPWDQTGVNRLPVPIFVPQASESGDPQTIPNPTSNLAFYFKLESIMKRWPLLSKQCVPDDLKTCINPDGVSAQCFPFFFIEAKREATDLSGAHLRSLYAASHALYNIHQCLKRVQGVEKDSDVKEHETLRTFSLCLNAKEFVVRAHSITFVEFGFPRFRHIIIHDAPYEGHAVSKVVRAILDTYASEDLFHILRKLFRGLTRPELVRALGARRLAEFIRSERSKDMARSLAYDSREINSPAMSIMTEEAELSTASQPDRRRLSEDDQRQSSAKRHKPSREFPVTLYDTPTDIITSSGASGDLGRVEVESQG